jgi:hypothetical protein
VGKKKTKRRKTKRGKSKRIGEEEDERTRS